VAEFASHSHRTPLAQSAAARNPTAEAQGVGGWVGVFERRALCRVRFASLSLVLIYTRTPSIRPLQPLRLGAENGECFVYALSLLVQQGVETSALGIESGKSTSMQNELVKLLFIEMEENDLFYNWKYYM